MSTRFVAAITYMTTLNAAQQFCLHICHFWEKVLLEMEQRGGGGGAIFHDKAEKYLITGAAIISGTS